MDNPAALDFATFKPRDYLHYYYDKIEEENQSLLDFFAQAYKDLPKDSVMMEFGGGPTIYQIISAAAHVKAIDFCDYIQANLDEVDLWKQASPGAFDWQKFVEHALKAEQLPATPADIKKREGLIRQKLRNLMIADAFMSDPCGLDYREYYDVLGISFVPEGITNSKEVWQQTLGNIVSLLKPGGSLVTVAVLEAEYWHSGDQVLPAVFLTEEDFKQTFPKLGLTIELQHTIPSEVLDHSDPAYTGYSGMIFIKAVKA